MRASIVGLVTRLLGARSTPLPVAVLGARGAPHQVAVALRAFVVLAVGLLQLVPAPASAQEGPNPARWEQDIRAFEAADLSDPPVRGGIVFTGSSSIRMWTTLKEDFAGLPVVNRGFGGSMLAEVTAFIDRTVVPHQPQLVVVNCGGNDINAGRSAAQVLRDFQALVAAIHGALPTTRIAYISIAPNPARWAQIETVKAANRAIQEFIGTDSTLDFIDVFPHMLGPDGLPKPDIFLEDRLHMNRKGYEIWTEVVRPHLRTARGR
jgi:lysophospholipase L1-like esterase